MQINYSIMCVHVGLGIVAVAYYYNITNSQNIEDDPIVNISHGKVKGVQMFSRGGQVFYGYHNIPYGILC